MSDKIAYSATALYIVCLVVVCLWAFNLTTDWKLKDVDTRHGSLVYTRRVNDGVFSSHVERREVPAACDVVPIGGR